MEVNTIYQGDCLEVMRGFPDNYFHSIVTDPPYGLKFMGKKWDYDVPSVEKWQECLIANQRIKNAEPQLIFGEDAI